MTGSTITLPAVTLDPGETLIVATNRHVTDSDTVTWRSISLNEDLPVAVWGSGPMYTSIWSLYSAGGGTGDIVDTSSASNSGDMIAIAVAGLDPAGALDATASNTGNGTIASSGSTAPTAVPREFLFAIVGGDDGSPLNGSWGNGLVAGQSVVGVNDETSEGFEIVSSSGNYDATLSNITLSQDWCAAIATYKAQP